MLHKIYDFSLQSHTGAYENRPLKSRLFLNDKPTDTFLPGFLIEAQYKFGDYYVIINSWDCPFEEANDFILLDSNLKIKSKRFLGAAYHTYTIDSISIKSDNQLLITLWEESQYILTIHRHLWIFPRPWLSLRRIN